MAAETGCVFNVAWKRAGDKSLSRGTYTADTIFRLLRILETAEGVTRENVEDLIIHQVGANNTTREVLCIENAGKPRIKLANLVETEDKETVYSTITTTFGWVANVATPL